MGMGRKCRCSIPYVYLPIRVWDIPYAYTRMGCLCTYGMPIRVQDDIFTEVLSYYKRLNLVHNSSIEVQTHRNCIILQNNKYFYRRLTCRIVLMLAIQLSVYNSYMHLSFSHCRNVLSQMNLELGIVLRQPRLLADNLLAIYSQLSETVMLRVVEQPPPT